MTKMKVVLEGVKYLFFPVQAPIPVTINEVQELDEADGSADGDLLLF